VKRTRRVAWSTVLRILGSVVGVALLIYLLASQDWDQIRLLFVQIGWWRLVAALGLTFCSRFAVAGRWHSLLRGARAPIRFKDSLEITFAGLFASNFLPTTIGGDIVRLAGAFQLEIDKAVSTASLIVDRLVGMAGMALFLPFGLAAGFEQLSTLLAASGSTSALLAGAVGAPQTGWLRRAAARTRSAALRVFRAIGLWIRKPGSLVTAMGCTLMHMVFLYSSIAILLSAMGEPLSLFTTAGLWSLVYFITLFPISINGLGLQEVALTAVFTQLGGISTQAALVLAVCLRVLAMLASLPGALYLGRVLPRAREAQQAGEVA
jgi:glycosyltransferase 2 family protein